MILLANGKVITRDPNGTGYYPDGGVVTDGGKIVEDTDPDTFFDHPSSDRAKQFLNTFTFDTVRTHADKQASPAAEE